jgi:hypothetical protein
MRCDPDEEPDSVILFALDESERFDLVVAYHARLPGDNDGVHIAVHVGVEEEVALDLLQRLRRRASHDNRAA